MRNIAALLSFLLLAAAGCSGNVKLSGTVSYSDDGAPVESGAVCFASTTKNFMARGTIENGKFTVGSVKENDGLPPGTYDVYFTGIERVVKEGGTNAAGESTEPETAPAVDLKYLSASTSGIQQTVDKKTKTVEYKLDRNPNFGVK